MRFQIDVRTKIILLLFTNYLLLIRMQSVYEWIVVTGIACLFIASSKIKQGVIYFLIFMTMFVFEHFVMQHVTGKNLSFLSMLAIGGRVMLPCFMAGAYIISTTSVHELIQGLRKWFFPEKLLLTIAVMVRFLPTIKQDYRTIRQSLRLKGVFMHGLDILVKPVIFFEYITVPLLMGATRSAQDLTVAVLTKSVSSRGKKTSYKQYHITFFDVTLYLFIIILICCIHLGIGVGR